MELTTKRILIAEDDKDISQLYKKALKDSGYKVKLVDNGETVLRSILITFKSYVF
jgi:DNA-binding response OmpR family regulator